MDEALLAEYLKASVRAANYPRTAQFAARQQFLRTVKELVPDVLVSLEEDVYPLHVVVFNVPRPQSAEEFDACRQDEERFLRDYPALAAALDEFDEARQVWWQRWGLDTGWMREFLDATLHHWYRSGCDGDWQYKPRFMVPGLSFAELAFSYEARSWHVTVEPWGEYESRVKAAFQERLAEYRKEMESFAKRTGQPIAKQARKIEGKGRDRHYRWLVQYHLKERTYVEIAAEETATYDADGCDAATVREAVRSLAEHLVLDLRVRRRGRRKRS